MERFWFFRTKKPWHGERKKKMKTQTSKQILPQDTMMSFFTASPPEETNLKSSSNVKMREEAKSKVCAHALGLRVHTSLCLMMLWILCAALWWCVPVGVCLLSQEQRGSVSAEIFSFLLLMLCSSCSSYCHCFPIFYCPAFWTRARGSSICTFWKCNNNNNDDDYSNGEN